MQLRRILLRNFVQRRVPLLQQQPTDYAVPGQPRTPMPPAPATLARGGEKVVYSTTPLLETRPSLLETKHAAARKDDDCAQGGPLRGAEVGGGAASVAAANKAAGRAGGTGAGSRGEQTPPTAAAAATSDAAQGVVSRRTSALPPPSPKEAEEQEAEEREEADDAPSGAAAEAVGAAEPPASAPPPLLPPSPHKRTLSTPQGPSATPLSAAALELDEPPVSSSLPGSSPASPAAAPPPTRPTIAAPTTTTTIKPELVDHNNSGFLRLFNVRGSNLLDAFRWVTDKKDYAWNDWQEPTKGCVHYVDEEEVLFEKIADKRQGKLEMSGEWEEIHGRGGFKSFRVETKKAYSVGAVVLIDVERIATGQGTLPAYWSAGVPEGDWPHRGEIDLLECPTNKPTLTSRLHTGEKLVKTKCDALTCAEGQYDFCDGHGKDFNHDCLSDVKQNKYGCGGDFHRLNGPKLNDAGGVLHAYSWTKKWIKVWQWARDEIPEGLRWADESAVKQLANGSMPGAYATWSFEHGGCDYRKVGDQKFIINLTVCPAGPWVNGLMKNNDWTEGGGISSMQQGGSCEEYVRSEAGKKQWRKVNGGRMPNFIINYFRVYKVPDLGSDDHEAGG